jgi:hypothetical protein
MYKNVDERKCPVCQKKFIPALYHVYKTHDGYHRLVCSYTCDMESLRNPKKYKKLKNRDNEIKELRSKEND